MSKNFLQNGKWIENPNTLTVIRCECGNKYIRTRILQTTCLTCMKELSQK